MFENNGTQVLERQLSFNVLGREVLSGDHFCTECGETKDAYIMYTTISPAVCLLCHATDDA